MHFLCVITVFLVLLASKVASRHILVDTSAAKTTISSSKGIQANNLTSKNCPFVLKPSNYDRDRFPKTLNIAVLSSPLKSICKGIKRDVTVIRKCGDCKNVDSGIKYKGEIYKISAETIVVGFIDTSL